MKASTNGSVVILVIDADPLTLTGVAAMLNLSGYECHIARDRSGALPAARAQSLDLVICDVDLQDASGLDLCQELRRLPNIAETPLLLVSEQPAYHLVETFRDLGSVYYLRKPFDPEVLLEIVEKAVWLPHLVTARVEQRHTPAPHWPAATRENSELHARRRFGPLT